MKRCDDEAGDGVPEALFGCCWCQNENTLVRVTWRNKQGKNKAYRTFVSAVDARVGPLSPPSIFVSGLGLGVQWQYTFRLSIDFVLASVFSCYFCVYRYLFFSELYAKVATFTPPLLEPYVYYQIVLVTRRRFRGGLGLTSVPHHPTVLRVDGSRRMSDILVFHKPQIFY